jgi:hypothetical protein
VPAQPAVSDRVKHQVHGGDAQHGGVGVEAGKCLARPDVLPNSVDLVFYFACYPRHTLPFFQPKINFMFPCCNHIRLDWKIQLLDDIMREAKAVVMNNK